MKSIRIIAGLLLVLSLRTSAADIPIELTNLRCEMLVNPLGIDAKQPRLSWQIEYTGYNLLQTGYQILVASSKEKLAMNEGDIWNSGNVSSSSSVYNDYAGKPLKSGQTCYWKLKIFTNKGNSEWSKPAYWSMGLLSQSDWKAKWIGYDKASSWDSVSQWSRLSARYLRKEFTSNLSVRRATVYIVGLGLYELFINGKKIGDQVLAPAPTDYRKSVLCNAFDVTTDIKSGKNSIATILGNGRFFTMRQDYKPQKINTFGFPKMLVQLEIEYSNGTKTIVGSDETWKLNVNGPIRSNNEYDGEEYDATKEMEGWNNTGFNDRNWLQAMIVSAPLGRIRSQMNPPMKIMRTISPLSIRKLDDDRYIMDMGQNFSGWIQMKAQGNRGKQVKLRFAESLQTNGELYTANLRDARVTDIYTLKGEGKEIWHPIFVYHGFRYVEISGYPGIPVRENFEGHFVYDDIESSSDFACSDSTINKIYRNAWWGIASNYKGMPIDCPQRNERQPWLGDRATGSGGEAFLFSNATLYAKWLDDIEESQTPEGAIPDVAPAFWNYYSDNMTWPGTYMLVANMLYHQFGDAKPIIKHYPSMKKWMEYMRVRYMKDFIVTKDKYGDWCVPPESLELIRSSDSLRTTKGELIATAYYYRLLQHLSQFAKLAGMTGDIKKYEELAINIRQSFQQRFFNRQRNCYDNNTVTANLLPLYFGITPDSLRSAVFNNIYNRIKIADGMHISTGVIGTQWLMRGLTDNGHPDMAFALASSKTYPSWGYMAQNGATTIWELWNGNTANPQMNSQNHVMLLGDLLIWLHEDVAGIDSDDKGIGFKTVRMKPMFIEGLNEVNASYRSLYGTINSHWKKENSGLSWNIRVPANANAIVYIPVNSADEIRDHGKSINGSENIKVLRIENGNVVLETGSGNYSFTVTSLALNK